MASPPKPGASRHDSAVSSTSSGNRTIRASPGKGRRRSSASTSAIATGLIARLTGRSKDQSRESNPHESEEEDVFTGDGSPTPLPGRQAKAARDEGFEAGASDLGDGAQPLQDSLASSLAFWRRESARYWSQELPGETLDEWPLEANGHSLQPPKWHPALDPGTIPTPGAEWGDRPTTEGGFAEHCIRSATPVNGSRQRVLEEVVGYFDRIPDTTEEGISFEIDGRLVRDAGDTTAKSPKGILDRNPGTLEFRLQDNISERTPSTPSVSLTGPDERHGNPDAKSDPKRLYPAISRLRSHDHRLRSHDRTPSYATEQSFRPHNHSRTPSHFSQASITRSDSISSVSDVRPVVQPGADPSTFAAHAPAFGFHPLRRLSSHLFSRTPGGNVSPLRPPSSRKPTSVLNIPFGGSSEPYREPKAGYGKPTVMDVRGMIAVGTESGYVLVYGFGQEIKFVLNSAGSGTVTAVTISPDQTYIGVGHSSGNIHLYDLSAPTKPARTTHALTLHQVLSGWKEGHLQGSRILHIGFVGKRHTSIVTGDEHGRAFWWSLGKVIGMDSNDVVRMLGSYPEKESDTPPFPCKRPTTLYAVLPLPLGDRAHGTDSFHLSALLTPTKLVIVGMKPQAKTWFRRLRDSSRGEHGGVTACAEWLKSGELNESGAGASDPVLAFSWGLEIRFLRVRTIAKEPFDATLGEVGPVEALDFMEERKWVAPNPLRAIQWFDQNHVALLTSDEIVLLDVRSVTPVENTSLQTALLTTQDSYSGLGPNKVPLVLAGSMRTYRGKLFLLVRSTRSGAADKQTQTFLQVGSLLLWNDRILARVHQGDFLGAIHVALAYYERKASGNDIGLPADTQERRIVVSERVHELIRASLDWAFSEERMQDDTHYSVDGRGVDLTGLFEGLASACIEACLLMDDMDFLYDEAFERFARAGIRSLFFDLLEPYIFDGRIKRLPPNVIQALISMHDERGEYDRAEAVIWQVEPTTLDINQAARLCEMHGLWDALVHVYTRAMADYIAPIVKLIRLVRDVQRHRLERSASKQYAHDLEDLAPNAYRLYAYMENVLSGLYYPTGERMPDTEALLGRSEVYSFLFSRDPVIWPSGPDGDVVLASDEPGIVYQYLQLLLQFDTEAFLHAMDIAFEDPYLNESSGVITRQSIVDLMLDVMKTDTFCSGDITFLHIFVARNLPKYSQFLELSAQTLHQILLSLASDRDQNTREDRQLAAEYLLSAYNPCDHEAMLELYKQAGFYRILRATYRRDNAWASLISTSATDPGVDGEIFASLDEIIQTATPTSAVTPQVRDAIKEALPQLLDLGVRQTALLIDKDISSLHNFAIESLSASEHKQVAYLRCLLDPSADDQEEMARLPVRLSPSAELDIPARHLYVSLLCRHDPEAVINFLDRRTPAFFDLPRLADDFEKIGFYEGILWSLEQQGKIHELSDTVGDVLRLKGADLGQALISLTDGEVYGTLKTIHTVSHMAVRLCREHSAGRTEHAEDMWFGVLHEIIELVHSVANLTPANARSSDDHGLEIVAVESIRLLVGETLQSLVSSSSQSLSFPRLFKRLVEASTPAAKKEKGRAYSEFRAILTGMLDSYRAEGDMLTMTTRLVQADLFLAVQDVTNMRQRGWRPVIDVCGKCGGSIRLPIETGLGRTIKLLSSGRVIHETCEEAHRLVVAEAEVRPKVVKAMQRSI